MRTALRPLLCLALLTGICYAVNNAPGGFPGPALEPIAAEAEEGKASGAQLMSERSASGGKYLRIDPRGGVQWDLTVEKAGYYRLEIRYRCTAPDREQFLVKNLASRAIGLEYAPDWAVFAADIFLRAGQNTLGLNSTQGSADLDSLKILQAQLTPRISPKKNVFYLKSPRDLFIKADLYGETLESVTSDGAEIAFSTTASPHQEQAVEVKLSGGSILKLPEGERTLKFNLPGGRSLDMELRVMGAAKPAELTIIAPHMDHGAAVLFLLPGGRTLLVDSGKYWARDSVLIPLLDRHGIKKLDYFIITHYHNDHDSEDRGAKIKARYGVDRFFDYKSFSAGDTLDLSGAELKVLNSFADGTSENTRSLSFRLSYKGFVYLDGGDNYSDNQQAVLKKFPADVSAHVYHAAHHMHGPIDAGYLRAINPALVLVQAQEAIYARSAYMKSFKMDVVPYLTANGKRFIEDLPSVEAGTVVIRVNSGSDWSYETYKGRGKETPLIPYLK